MLEHHNQHDTQHTNPQQVTRLSAQDANVLDAMLEARARGHDVGPLPPNSAQRAHKLQKALDLLQKFENETPPADLTQRTMDKIHHFKQQQRFAQQVDMLRQPRGFTNTGMRMAASVAILAVMGASVLLPALSRMHHESQRIACASNVQQIGVALGQYAADHGGAMPRVATAGNWTGTLSQGINQSLPDAARAAQAQAQQHAANRNNVFELNSSAASLFNVIRSGYAQKEAVRCPSYNATPTSFANDAVDFGGARNTPFAFQAQPVQGVILLEQEPRRIILADRNPLACQNSGRVQLTEKQNRDVPSHSHPIVGQNTLYADGRVIWTVRPIIVRKLNAQPVQDNIWVPQDVPTTKTNDTTQVDVFLTQ